MTDPLDRIDGFRLASSMTLRDYFAGQALAGMKVSGAASLDGPITAASAESAYAIADAMMEQRRK